MAIPPNPCGSPGGVCARAAGELLTESGELAPSYPLRGDETYHRARVMDSGGRVARVQPAFVVRER